MALWGLISQEFSRAERFDMWSSLKVGVMDIIHIIRRCIYAIWCKVVIQIVIFFIMYAGVIIIYFMLINSSRCWRRFLLQGFIIPDTSILQHHKIFVIGQGVLTSRRLGQGHVFFHGFYNPEFRY